MKDRVHLKDSLANLLLSLFILYLKIFTYILLEELIDQTHCKSIFFSYLTLEFYRIKRHLELLITDNLRQHSLTAIDTRPLQSGRDNVRRIFHTAKTWVQETIYYSGVRTCEFQLKGVVYIYYLSKNRWQRAGNNQSGSYNTVIFFQ